MKKIFTYSLILVLGWLNAQVGIGTDNPDGKLEIKQLNLSQQEVVSFQEQSENQLNDVYELMSHLSNPELDEELKSQLKQSILNYFSSEETVVMNLLDSKKSVNYIKAFLNKISESKKPIQFKVKNLETSKLIGNFWILNYTIVTTKETQSWEAKIEQMCVLEEVQKQFGDKTKTVWALRFKEL